MLKVEIMTVQHERIRKDGQLNFTGAELTLKKLPALGGPGVDLRKTVSHELASRRAKVEHVFRDFKLRLGYVKVRYRGQAKNLSRITLLADMANLFRARDYERHHGMIAS